MGTKMKKCSVALTFVLLMALLLNGQMAFSLEPSINVLGDLAGNGKAEMKVLDRWVSVADKTFPVVDGARLRSGEGRMSIILRDGARIEIGKNSECEISGSKGDYAVRLQTGNVGFSVPKGISLVVTTNKSQILVQPAEMLQKVKYENEEIVNGVVSCDGKGTKVMSESGTLAVKNANGSETQVAAGKRIYIADNGSVESDTPISSAGGTAASTADPVSPALGFAGAAAGVGGITVLGNQNWVRSSPPPPISVSPSGP